MSRTSPRLPGRSLARSRCDPRTAYSVGRISLAVGMRTLETERLLIRPFVPGDAAEFKRLLDGAFGTDGYGSHDATRRSEEHTSELQSQSNFVCRLLLEKKTASTNRPILHAVLEALRLRQGLQLLEGVVLDLTDSLAGDAEGLADLLERARLTAGEPESQLDHLALALGQRRQGMLDVLAPKRQRGVLVRRFDLIVLDEIAELGVLLLADRPLHRDLMLLLPQDLPYLARPSPAPHSALVLP